MGFFDEEHLSSDGMMGYEQIRDPGQISRFLLKALTEGENVEVQINDRTRTFFTNFMDHLPNLAPKPTPAPKEGEPNLFVEPVLVEPHYERFSYLRERNRLVVAPLVPAVGNAHIRQSEEVLIRFFQGVKSIEASVAFLNMLEVRGEPAIQLSYPSVLWLLRKRRHFRAKVVPEVGLRLKVHKFGMDPIDVTLIDISAGGLAFCNPIAADLLPHGEQLHLQLLPPELPPIKINAFIRNHNRASTKDGCRTKGAMRCGVQFDILNEHQAMEIEELVAFVQRSQLQQIQEHKASAHKNSAPTEPAEEKKRGSLSEELGKLLKLKNKFPFHK